MKFVTGIPKNLRTKPAAAPCNEDFVVCAGSQTPRGAGLSPSTERHSASQATAGSEQSGHAVTGGAARAAISWASSPRHRRRSRADICDQACGRPSLSVEIHVRRAAARRLSSRRAASQRRWSGDHTPGRRCLCDCAGVAVVKKLAARISFRGLRARKDTIAHATESHGVRRATIAVAQRTGAQRACRVACGVGGDCERERLRSKARLDSLPVS